MHVTSMVAVELPPVIEEAVRRAVASLGERQVAIIAEYPAHLPAVRAQAEELPALVEALVGVAAGWVAQGEVRVRAELASPEALEGIPAALVSVRVPPDQVRPEAVKSLEKPQGPTAPEGDPRLELQRAEALAASWKGSLSASWSREQGAEIRLTLPLWAGREVAPGVQAVQRAVEDRLSSLHPGTKTLLLMVEDLELRGLLASDLEQAGYALVVPEHGSDVLPLVRQERPDLVMLDVMLRDPPPFDLATLIKQDRTARNTPVLFLTSGTDEEDPRQVGAVGFVVRPSGTGAILATIQSVLSAGLRRSARVMVVEPNTALREAMIVMLQQQDFRVTEAMAAEEALVLAERLEPAVVLVNAQVAQARDYWLLRRLRRLSESMQIVVMAEAMSEAEGRAAIRRGASGFGETGKLPDLLNQVKRHSGSA
ncbi:MAG: response regulator [Anaerolineales bacterium]|nr:response regulator [Anaerolineales bacterium]